MEVSLINLKEYDLVPTNQSQFSVTINFELKLELGFLQLNQCLLFFEHNEIPFQEDKR